MAPKKGGTGKRPASAAGQELQSPKIPKSERSVAASDLAQVKRKKKKKKKSK